MISSCLFSPISGIFYLLSDLVHASEVQSLVRVPNLGKRARLDTGPLLHSLGAWICTVHVGNVYWESKTGRRTEDLVIDLCQMTYQKSRNQRSKMNLLDDTKSISQAIIFNL